MYQVGTACYATAIAANQAIASSQTGAVVQQGSTLYVSIATGTANGIEYALHPLAGGPVLGQSIALTPEPCGLLTASDGLQMGWMVAAVWVAAFSVVFLARIVRGDTGPDTYGNT